MTGKFLPIHSVILVALTWATGRADQASDPLRSRSDFAKAINKVREGMLEAEVLALLGPPDDILTKRDLGGVYIADMKEIWRYGTSGHKTVATLGQVYVNTTGRVQAVFGKGLPPKDDLFEERHLRSLLEALGQAPACNGKDYNPRPLVRIVNLLQPLGKEKALAVIEEYLRVTSDWPPDREGMFLVLRTLFKVSENPGYMPSMGMGASDPPAPANPQLLPRFPISIEGDIPFLVVHGYSLEGVPEDPQSHVEYFRKYGKIRARPLVPTTKPFAAIEEFASSPRWPFPDSNSPRGAKRGYLFLGEQVLRLMDSVYRVEPDALGRFLPYGDDAGQKRIVGEVSNLKIRWNATTAKYTLLDGTSLP